MDIKPIYHLILTAFCTWKFSDRHISDTSKTGGTTNLVKYQNLMPFFRLIGNWTTKLFLLNQTILKIFKQPISNQTKLIPDVSPVSPIVMDL